ncbi:MAG TPA: hypothetical protein VFW66_08050 [Gemmatimonadales bacterium]|nr:hypothetical protein [Gemmatimonadales bacterium]
MDTPMSAAAAPSLVTKDRIAAIVSYVTLIGFIVAIFMHQKHKTDVGAFHLRQMLGLLLTSAAASVCAIVPILGWLVWLLVLLGLFPLWIIGLVAAVRGAVRPVPILGAHYQRWFAGAFG